MESWTPIPLGGRRAVLYNNSIGQSGDDPRVFASSSQVQVHDIWRSGAHPCVVPRYFHFQNISSLLALESVVIVEQLVVPTLPYLGNFQKLWRFLWQLRRFAECTFKVKFLNLFFFLKKSSCFAFYQYSGKHKVNRRGHVYSFGTWSICGLVLLFETAPCVA